MNEQSTKLVLLNPYDKEHLRRLEEFELLCTHRTEISKMIEDSNAKLSETEYLRRQQHREITELNVFTETNNVFTMGLYLQVVMQSELAVEFLINSNSDYQRDLPLLIKAVEIYKKVLFNDNNPHRKVVYQFDEHNTELIKSFKMYFAANNYEVTSEDTNGSYKEFTVCEDYSNLDQSAKAK